MVTSLADLAILSMMIRASSLIARRATHGVSMLRFGRFPFVPGEEVELMLARRGPLATLDRLEATLRCVQERYEMRGSGSGRLEVRAVMPGVDYRKVFLVPVYEAQRERRGQRAG